MVRGSLAEDRRLTSIPGCGHPAEVAPSPIALADLTLANVSFAARGADVHPWALPANYVRSVLGPIGAPALVICLGEEVWLSAGDSRCLEREIPDKSARRIGRS
jgi:hypothetical protein